MRYDLAFFLCCCKSFLGSSTANEDDFYVLLGLERNATPEEIKRAYKRQSLQMHPDKLAQKGKVVTEEDQSRFTRMKEAYDVSHHITTCIVSYISPSIFSGDINIRDLGVTWLLTLSR
jgi:hypothetical protein